MDFMSKKRIIPCLDVRAGRVVKGVNFVNIKDAGDPVENARYYEQAGADELAMLDITATTENRETMKDVVMKVARQISIPLTVGGGIKSVDDFEKILNAGASKISINTAAFMNPGLISEAAQRFGSRRVVVAIDAVKKQDGTGWDVVISGGQVNTGKSVVDWAFEVERLGCGEILLTSMDRDGTKEGYDLELTRIVSESVKIPVIASGGAGTMEHFYDALTIGKADAVLAASLFHFREVDIKELRLYLRSKGIDI